MAWDRLAGYVELHIEQGPVLERFGVPIGVVGGISGCQRGWVSFDGQAGHAGTTPMDLRHDALLAAAQTVLFVNRIAREGDVEVATAGALQVYPGNANVIAGQASVSFDLRSMDDNRARSAVERLRAEVVEIGAATSTSSALSVTTSTNAVATDKIWHTAIGVAATGLGVGTLELASGAGHDAQQLARLAPVGMIFVPSTRGISHNAAEATEPDALVTGARVNRVDPGSRRGPRPVSNRPSPQGPPRDLVGYAGTPPTPHWPGGASIAVQFVLNYEEGGERTVLDGDPTSETFLSEMIGADAFQDRHMSMESLYEYGSRAGFWRVIRLFESYHLPAHSVRCSDRARNETPPPWPPSLPLGTRSPATGCGGSVTSRLTSPLRQLIWPRQCGS